MELPVLLVYSVIRHYSTEKVAIMALTAMFLVLMEVEYIRLEVKPKLPNHLNIFREKERNNVTGSIFFIAATIICFAVFDYSIALLALLLTVFGDLASALIGIKFGKHKIFHHKSFEGFLAGLAMNLVVGALVLTAYPAIFISMALVASIVELMTGKLDDNLTVPLFAGFTGQIIAYSLGAQLNVLPAALGSIFSLLTF